MGGLEELKKKKAMLLKKAGVQNANLTKIRQRKAEENKLKAEIFALEHPGSDAAREKVKRTASKLSGFIKRTAATVANNAVRMENERKARARADREKEREVEKLRLKAASKRKSKPKKKPAAKRPAKKKKGNIYGDGFY